MAFHTDAIDRLRNSAQGLASGRSASAFSGLVELVDDALNSRDKTSSECDIESTVDALLELNIRADALNELPLDGRGEFSARTQGELQAFNRFQDGIASLIPLATRRIVENLNGQCACKLPLSKAGG